MGEDQTQRLEERVIAAAAKMMEERGKAFTELNKKEVLEVVAPFKAQLTDFRQRVDQIYDTGEQGARRAQAANPAAHVAESVRVPGSAAAHKCIDSNLEVHR